MPKKSEAKPSYEDMVRLVSQIIIEELCNGSVRSAAARSVQIVAAWSDKK